VRLVDDDLGSGGYGWCWTGVGGRRCSEVAGRRVDRPGANWVDRHVARDRVLRQAGCGFRC
jgi:hypothetical protein